tara:strand:- start:621 stop:944 length:324 start_codon:yes stop_codon:yes gene_type:complete
MEQEFKLVENEKFPKHIGIQLTNGPFSGIILIYGNVKFSKDEPPVLKFDYEVMQNPEKHKYKNNEEFDDIIGDILVQLIDEKYNDRKNNLDKPDHEYTVFEEGDTIS